MENITELINQLMNTMTNQNTESSLTALSKSSEYCPKCHRSYKNYHEEYKGYGIIYHCDCEREEKIKEVEEIIRENKKRRIEKLFQLSNLGRRFMGCSFDNFEKRKGTEAALIAAKEFVRNFEVKLKTGEGVLFYGPAGNGKTHLAAAITKEIIKKGYSAIFQPTAELMYRINRTYEIEEESEHDIIGGLIESHLLILDDLGKGKWSEKVEERIYVVLDGRYRNLYPTIITTNKNMNGLESYVGGAVFDRLKEMAVMVHNSASSYRKLKMKEEGNVRTN